MSRISDNGIMLLVRRVPMHELGVNVRESVLHLNKSTEVKVSLYCVGSNESLFFIEHYDSEPEKKNLVKAARQVMNGYFYDEH